MEKVSNLKRVTGFLFLMWSMNGFAQQLPQYTQYMLNDFAINPAVAGRIENVWDCKSNNRYQWVGVTDAPRTYILSMHGPFKGLNMGIGGMLYTDIVGPTRRVGIQLAYSYHLKINSEYKLNMGINGGFLQYSLDGSKITFKDGYDPVTPMMYRSYLTPDFGAGLYLHSEKLYIGLSVPQMIQTEVRFKDVINTGLSRLKPHYYLLAGYKMKMSGDFAFEPTALIKFISPTPIKVDAGARITYQDKIWIGANYRTNDAITALIGFTYNSWLTFGYSYDYTTTALQQFSTGTHEIMLGLRFSKPTNTYKDELEY